MGVRTKVRLHFTDGRGVITETLRHFAAQNDMTLAEARDQIEAWVKDGSLVERKDGGYDVIRFHGRKVRGT
jgi:hypothetical protein